MACLKYAWLMLKRFVHRVLNRLPIILSYFFLAFSVLICLAILIPNWFDRVPVLSYYISEHKLPIKYELHGEVKILDENGGIVNKNIEVFVGGYSISLVEPKFDLKFSSPVTDKLFVVIRYEIDGCIRTFTKYITINNENHVIQEEFIIYA